jgi:ferredoxin
MIAELKQRVETLSAADLLSGGCNLVITESAEDIHYRAESVDRRSFFKSFRTSLLTSAAVILSSNNEQTELRTDYSRKRLPIRRALLNSTRNRLSMELLSQLQKSFDSYVSFNENCINCQGCVAICPTGALKTKQGDILPEFDHMLCTGCGLCREFCMDEALRISGCNINGCGTIMHDVTERFRE